MWISPAFASLLNKSKLTSDKYSIYVLRSHLAKREVYARIKSQGKKREVEKKKTFNITRANQIGKERRYLSCSASEVKLYSLYSLWL